MIFSSLLYFWRTSPQRRWHWLYLPLKTNFAHPFSPTLKFEIIPFCSSFLRYRLCRPSAQGGHFYYPARFWSFACGSLHVPEGFEESFSKIARHSQPLPVLWALSAPGWPHEELPEKGRLSEKDKLYNIYRWRMYLKVEQPILELSAPFLEKRFQNWREVSFTHARQNLIYKSPKKATSYAGRPAR